eukprot:CAMPEP_0180540244 /NCGR_PEP_ID=MMETSP1036_2-20121128/67315_1 /TAXON_ID=632150 /ORGANISM="Azadinium spinosum, Strain 3D9" /LENGTH=90 /DNA_ID=CAMNT_0022555031 /DNA_START=198 /DNA_END=467 /DNA_ORIENTATION=-
MAAVRKAGIGRATIGVPIAQGFVPEDAVAVEALSSGVALRLPRQPESDGQRQILDDLVSTRDNVAYRQRLHGSSALQRNVQRARLSPCIR